MIELVDDVPNGVFGLRAGGLVTPQEYQSVVRPALSQWLTSADSLRVLAIIEPDFSYADGDWHTAADGVLQRPEWRRLGVVTDSGWLRRMAPVGARFVPARVRGFRSHRVHDAKTWVAR
jgi:hypothetical protein